MEASKAPQSPGDCYYPYEAIVKKWNSYLVWKGADKATVNALLKTESLVKGCALVKDDSVWGVPHLFYEATLRRSAERNLYFPEKDIDSLLDIITARQPDLDRKMLYPNPSRRVNARDFADIRPITFGTTGDLQACRHGQKTTENALLLQQNRQVYADFQTNAKGAVMAIDIESWERNHSILTELGWSYIEWSPAEDDQLREDKACEHIIIAENLRYRNGNYAPDNRNHFNFGGSAQISLKKGVTRLIDLVSRFKARGPLILVFHNASAEIEYFATLGLDTSTWITGFPILPKGQDTLKLTDGDVYIMDTQKLFSASGLKEAIPQIKLANALTALGIPHRRLHNAGNDACYTLAVYEALVGAGTIKEALVQEELARSAKEAQKRTQNAGWGWD